jgi:RNA polymerase sigma-70 factor (ECF subfamily)
VVQDTFIRAYRALPRFRGDASGRTWLLVIARRAAADALRTKNRIRRTERQTMPDLDGSLLDTALALQSLIDGLDTDRREAFVLTQIVGCSYAEAAAICGVRIGTIRSRVARAREALLEQVHAARSA